jgi:hypothetical protein
MNPHLEIRLAQLAKEIEAAKAPKIDAEANARFLVNTSVRLSDGTSTFISEADCQQFKGAPQVLPSERTQSCDPKATTPVGAPPSPQAEQPAPLKKGDHIRPLYDWAGWTSGIVHRVGPRGFDGKPCVWYDNGSPYGLVHDLVTDVELIAAPQEAAKGDAEGWVAWAGGKRPVDGSTLVEVRYGDNQKDGSRTVGYAESWTGGWGANCAYCNRITAYRVIKP